MTQPLQTGEMLQWYRLERVLGRGGFGITYLATDTNLDHLVAIKEYAPNSQVQRNEDNSLKTVDNEALEIYDIGLNRFIAEARTLVKFNHPNLVRILTVFEANKTAYLVMEYEEGEIFKEYVARNYVVPESRLKEIFLKITDGLQQVHERGFLHRDIKPANIIIRKNGYPVLLDFGCARPALIDKQVTHTAFVSPGYSPLEQLHEISGLEEGPWTDIYALSATLHFAISNKTPPNSTSRLAAVAATFDDPLIPATEVGKSHYSQPFLESIDWGLKSQITDRPATLAQWREALTAYPSPGDDATVLLPKGVAENLNAGTIANTGTQLPDPVDTTRVQPVRAQTNNIDQQRDVSLELRQESDPWDATTLLKEQPPKSSKSGLIPVIFGVCVMLAGSVWFFMRGEKPAEPARADSTQGILAVAPSGSADSPKTTGDSKSISESKAATVGVVEEPSLKQQQQLQQQREVERRQEELKNQEQKRLDAARQQQQEQQEQAELKRQEDKRRQEEEEQSRQNELQLQADQLRLDQLRIQQENLKQEQQRIKAERQAELLRQEELDRQKAQAKKLEALRKLEEEQKQEELQRQAKEQLRIEELQAQEAERQLEQQRRQEAEKQRLAAELKRQEELHAQKLREERRREQQRQEELRKRKQEELDRQAKQRRQDDRQADLQRQEAQRQEEIRLQQEAKLQEEREQRTVTQQDLGEAEFRLKQLARAITNRNLVAVDKLTESNDAKYAVLKALISKSMKMDVRIKNLEADNGIGQVSAILELTTIVMAGGQTFVPARSLREHVISIKKNSGGWGKIEW